MEKKILIIILGVITILVAGVTTYLGVASKNEPVPTTNEDTKGKEDTGTIEEELAEQENTKPTTKSEIPTQDEKFFISENHDFYNKTTGWGRIDQLDYSNQLKNAEGIIRLTSELETSQALEIDLQRIKKLAESILNKDNNYQKSVLYLHRMFHDLDEEVNGYSHADYFGVTEYGNGKKTHEVINLVGE